MGVGRVRAGAGWGKVRMGRDRARGSARAMQWGALSACEEPEKGGGWTSKNTTQSESEDGCGGQGQEAHSQGRYRTDAAPDDGATSASTWAACCRTSARTADSRWT